MSSGNFWQCLKTFLVITLGEKYANDMYGGGGVGQGCCSCTGDFSVTRTYLAWNVKNPALHLKNLDQPSYLLLPTLRLVGYPRTPSCASIHRPTTLYCNCPLAKSILRTKNVFCYSRVWDWEYSSKKQLGTVCTRERKCCILTLNSATH